MITKVLISDRLALYDFQFHSGTIKSGKNWKPATFCGKIDPKMRCFTIQWRLEYLKNVVFCVRISARLKEMNTIRTTLESS